MPACKSDIFVSKIEDFMNMSLCIVRLLWRVFHRTMYYLPEEVHVYYSMNIKDLDSINIVIFHIG